MTDTGFPAQTEFTASNGLKVATDVRGAVGVQWGAPRAGGWTFHDSDSTSALQEFFAHNTPTVSAPVIAGPWQLHPVDGSDGSSVNIYYDAPARDLLQTMGVPTADLPGLIATLNGAISAPVDPAPWKVDLVEDDEHVSVSYAGSFELEAFSGEFDTQDLDSLIAHLVAIRQGIRAPSMRR